MKVFDFTDWELTQDTLQDVLDYDPKTGNFVGGWVKPSARVAVGQARRIAGRQGLPGDRASQSAKVYKAHRLAWLYVCMASGRCPIWTFHQSRSGMHIRIKNFAPGDQKPELATATPKGSQKRRTEGRTHF